MQKQVHNNLQKNLVSEMKNIPSAMKFGTQQLRFVNHKYVWYLKLRIFTLNF